MRINQNIAAFNAFRNLSVTNNAAARSLEKLSSGYRINRAADDAAGLVISQGLRAQISGLQQATRNAQDGISVVQTAEGALQEVHSMLNRIRDLAVQASNTGSNDADAKAAAQAEVEQLTDEIDRIADRTKFGSQALLDGTFGAAYTVTSDAAAFADITVDGDNDTLVVGGKTATIAHATYESAQDYEDAVNAALAEAGSKVSLSHTVGEGGVTWKLSGPGAFEVTSGADDLGIDDETDAAETGTGGTFQVGANVGDSLTVTIDEMSASSLSIDNLDLESDASAAIEAVDDAIAAVSTQRASLGAYQNRLESVVSSLQVANENLSASESRIRDTDMALEMVSFTRHQILLQAGTAMLAQANQIPSTVLQLLK